MVQVRLYSALVRLDRPDVDRFSGNCFAAQDAVAAAAFEIAARHHHVPRRNGIEDCAPQANAQNSGRKIAIVRIGVLNDAGASRSLRANEFVSLEIINDSLHAEGGFIGCDFVAGSNIGDDLAHRFAFFETLPNNHRGLVQLIISFSC